MATQQAPGHAEAMSAEGQPDHNVRARKRGRMPSDPPPSPTSNLAPAISVPKRRRKGSKGRKGITDLPTDLLLEVALRCRPLDLLQFSRTSKFLREILLSKKNVKTWQRSIVAVDGLPACPTDMSEPAYVALVFDNYCFLCEASADRRSEFWVDFAIRIRLCNACLAENIKPASELIDDLSRYELGLNFIPRKGGDVRFNAEAIMALDSKHKINDHYYVRDVDEMMMKFDHQYLAEDIVTQRRLRSEMKARYSQAVDVWKFMERCKTEKAQAIDAAKQKRISEIEARLIKLKIEEEKFPRHHPEWIRLVEQSKPLTERIWKGLLPKLIQLIETRNDCTETPELPITKRVSARLGAIDAHYTTFTWTRPDEEKRFMPNSYDARSLPSIVALARENDAHEPAVSYADFLAISARVLGDIAAYKTAVQHALVALLCATSPAVAADLAGLDPATALRRYPAAFRCRKGCSTHLFNSREYMTYEDVYVHWWISHSAKFLDEGLEPRLAAADKPDKRVGVPTMGPFSFPDVAREILLTVGIPPDTEREVLDAWVMEGRLFCACRSAGAEITSDRCKIKKPGAFFSESTGWMKLVRHVMRHTWLYHGRKELMKKNDFPLPDLPGEGEPFLYEDHPLSHGDPEKCVVKFLPEGADTAPAASCLLKISDPAQRVEISNWLRTPPGDSPGAVPVCGVCLSMVGLTTVGDRRQVKDNLALLTLRPGTEGCWPSALAWHMSVCHGLKDVKKQYIAWFDEDHRI